MWFFILNWSQNQWNIAHLLTLYFVCLFFVHSVRAQFHLQCFLCHFHCTWGQYSFVLRVFRTYTNSKKKDVEVQVLSELTVRRAVEVGCYLLRTYFQVFPGNKYRRPSRTKFSVKWRSCDTISVKGVNECSRIVCLSLFLSYHANFNGF